MSYAPNQGGRVYVSNPNGISVSVNITAASGRSITVYTDAARTSSVAMPDTITGNKTYFTDRDDLYTVSVKSGSNEVGVINSGATPGSQYLREDEQVSVLVDKESADLHSSGTSVTLADKGAWVTSTAYAVGDVVTQSSNRYICKTAHTSGTFATDLAAGDWTLTGLATAAPAWNTVSKTTTYTAVASDEVLASASGGAWALTLPAVSNGIRVRVKKTDSSTNAVTVTPASGTIDGAGTLPIGTQYQAYEVVSDGTNWFIV